ncbi:MAG: YgcG family protein [bacterium]
MRKIKILPVILIVLFLFQVSSLGKEASFPQPVGYVNDFANLLPSSDVSRLTGLITELERKTTSEIAIVTLESIPEGDIESYAVDLFESWGIGKKGEDNGLLILVSVGERLVRIEVGYGLEGIITDGMAGEVIRQKIAPSFGKGQFGEGLFNGTAALANLIAREKGVELSALSSLPQENYEVAVGGGSQRKRALVNLLYLFLILLFLGGRFFLLPWLFFMGRGGFWGRGGGGFGGGGFGGFGGGLSGGGGATGRW